MALVGKERLNFPCLSQTTSGSHALTALREAIRTKMRPHLYDSRAMDRAVFTFNSLDAGEHSGRLIEGRHALTFRP